MHLRDGADAVRRQELALVEHHVQHAPQLIAVENRQQAPLAPAWCPHAGHVLGQVGPVLDEPFETSAESVVPHQCFRLERLHGEQRNQADERSNLERGARVVGRVQHIVEESVLVVPEVVAAAAVA